MFVKSTVRAAGPAIAVAVLVLLAGCSGDDSNSSSTPKPTTAAATPGGTSGTAASGPVAAPPTETGGPEVAIRTMAPVKIGSKKGAAMNTGTRVTVSGVKDIKVKASGPGEVAGPAVRVTVRVQNNSTHSLDLGGFAVNATVGKNQPASPSNSSPADPLTGRLAAGKSAVGTYVFTVPGSKFDGLVVQVSSDSAANIAVFRR